MRAEPGCFTESHPAPDRYAPPLRDEPAAISAVLTGGMLSGGAQVVADYEAALAARFGVAHAIAVNSGSSALHAVLHVLGAQPGSEVLVPATASLPTAFPILSAGATPVITDVAAGGLGLDPQDVARKITSRTVAAISLPLWGYPAAVTPAAQVLANAGIPLVEDAAQAHGTRIAGLPEPLVLSAAFPPTTASSWRLAKADSSSPTTTSSRTRSTTTPASGTWPACSMA